MKILVFGGAGYIGTHTVLELLDAGYSVVVFDDFSTGERLNIDKRATIYEGNILSKVDLITVFNDHDFDAVMHFAGLKSARKSMNNPEDYSDINIIGSINILNQMIKNNVSKFIFSSSSSIYGEPIKSKINESHPLQPISYYGFTKLEVENILKWYSTITNLNFVSLRYFNAAGYDMKSRIKIPEKRSPNLIPRIMKVLLKKQEFLEIFGSNHSTKDGTCIRDYIHVSDIALAHIESLNYLNHNLNHLVLNLATGNGYSILEIIKEFERQSGYEIPFKFANRRSGDPSIVVSSSDLKNKEFKWEPKYSNLESIISSVLSIYKIKKNL